MRHVPAFWSAIVWLSLPLASFAQPVVLNPLSEADLATFFHLPEGGAVMPFDWYHAIEVVDSRTGQPTGQTFAERMHVYGFLDDEDHDLPVGFGVVELDFLGNLPGLSLNCAACHVGEITTDGGVTRLRIIGGPNLADVRTFSQDVYVSLLATLTNPPRMLQFLKRSGRLKPETTAVLRQSEVGWAAPTSRQATIAPATRQKATSSTSRQPRVVGTAHPTNSGAQLGGALLDVYRNSQLFIAEARYFTAQGQFPLSTNEGYGRLDAFATVRFLLFPDESRNFPFTAPVSVTPLWGIADKQWLHWNANTNSTLQRNISQAMGMGALQTSQGITNVLMPNLDTLERIAHQITPPAWPAEIFGPLDANLVEQGRTLYEARCAICHDAGTVNPQTGLITYPLFSLAETGTDPNYALNFHQPVGTRPFAEAMKSRLDTIEQWYFVRRDPRNPVPRDTQIEWSGGESRLPAAWRDPLAKSLLASVYPALPLKGVWATAPYLHNNSVPTLRDLLKPASERPQIFQAGHRDYDPINVGYQQPANPEDISAPFRFDTRDAGNSNAGHEGPEFGADGLSEPDIAALLEYLKSL